MSYNAEQRMQLECLLQHNDERLKQGFGLWQNGDFETAKKYFEDIRRALQAHLDGNKVYFSGAHGPAIPKRLADRRINLLRSAEKWIRQCADVIIDKNEKIIKDKTKEIADLTDRLRTVEAALMNQLHPAPTTGPYAQPVHHRNGDPPRHSNGAPTPVRIVSPPLPRRPIRLTGNSPPVQFPAAGTPRLTTIPLRSL